MRAARVIGRGGPASITSVRDQPVPQVGPGELLVEVHVAGVTFPDVLQSRGEYQHTPEAPFTLGAEFAGAVVTAPPESSYKIGDRVAGVGSYGAFAEYVACHQSNLFPLPDSVSYKHGAGMPMNILTADFALTKRGYLREGETVLVHGAGGGLGLSLVQMSSALGGETIAVVSTPEKQGVAEYGGAKSVVRVDGFRASVAELTSGRGVDIVADPVGGDRFTDSLRSLSAYGRLLVLGFTGRSIPEVKVNRLLLKNIAVIGVGWGEARRLQTVDIQEQWNRLLPKISSGMLNPFIGKVVSLEEVSDAVIALDERRSVGKTIVLVKE